MARTALGSPLQNCKNTTDRVQVYASTWAVQERRDLRWVSGGVVPRLREGSLVTTFELPIAGQWSQ